MASLSSPFSDSEIQALIAYVKTEHDVLTDRLNRIAIVQGKTSDATLLQRSIGQLAQRAGFTGLSDAPSVVYGTILAERFDGALALKGLGGRHRIGQNYFKLHACCRFNHFGLDAVMALARDHRLAWDEVAKV